jgi:hypothetical protein
MDEGEGEGEGEGTAGISRDLNFSRLKAEKVELREFHVT